MELDTSHIRSLATSETGFVFDPSTGHTFTVNSTGLAILGLLKDGIALDAIEKQLAAQFDVEPQEDLRRDLQDFIAELRSLGLVR